MVEGIIYVLDQELLTGSGESKKNCRVNHSRARRKEFIWNAEYFGDVNKWTAHTILDEKCSYHSSKLSKKQWKKHFLSWSCVLWFNGKGAALSSAAIWICGHGAREAGKGCGLMSLLPDSNFLAPLGISLGVSRWTDLVPFVTMPWIVQQQSYVKLIFWYHV